MADNKGIFKKRIRVIWEFAKPQKWTFISAEVCLLISYTLELILPLILAVMIDEVLYHKNSNVLLKFVILFIIIYVGWNLTWLIYAFTWQRLNNKFVLNIKMKLFSKILYAKASYMSNANTGDLIARIDGDADQFIHIMQRNMFHLINSIASCVISLLLIARINLSIAVVMIISIVFPIITTHFLGKRVDRLAKHYREKYGGFIGRVYEILAGMREIKLFSAKPWARSFFLKNQIELSRLDIKNSKVAFVTGKTNDFISLIATLIIYIISALLIFSGNLTVGFFIAIIEYTSSIQGMVKWSLVNYLEWQNRKVNVDRVAEILELDVENNDKVKNELQVSNGEVSFNNVSFHYEEGNPVLSDVSFFIKAGEKVAIVGASGVGKTTITGLLLNFYELFSGQISIDGQDISQCTYKSLRRNIGIVQQDIILFDGSIKMNLLLGKSNATDDELWQACRKSHIADFINTLPEKMDTILSRDGSGFSIGQKQRLMIARIFLKNPPILVFDEVTSALDSEAEQIITDSIYKLGSNKTVITVSHRLSTIMKMDKIIVLHDGKVVSFGSHNYLMGNCAYYTQLFEGQLMKAGDYYA